MSEKKIFYKSVIIIHPKTLSIRDVPADQFRPRSTELIFENHAPAMGRNRSANYVFDRDESVVGWIQNVNILQILFDHRISHPNPVKRNQSTQRSESLVEIFEKIYHLIVRQSHYESNHPTPLSFTDLINDIIHDLPTNFNIHHDILLNKRRLPAKILEQGDRFIHSGIANIIDVELYIFT